MANLTAGLGLTTMLENYGYAPVSSGTLHPQDLVEAGYSAVMRYAEPGQELDSWSKEILSTIPPEAWEDRGHLYWDSEGCLYVQEDISEALNSIAPEGYWFGASEGDGADFAIWPVPAEYME